MVVDVAEGQQRQFTNQPTDTSTLFEPCKTLGMVLLDSESEAFLQDSNVSLAAEYIEPRWWLIE